MEGQLAVVIVGKSVRRLVAVTLTVPLVLVGCQQPSPAPTVDPRTQRALPLASLSYSVTRESDAIVIRSGTSEVVVETDLGDTVGSPVVPLPNQRFAVVGEGKLAALGADGLGSVVPLDKVCGDLTPAGERILLMCAGSELRGSEFQVRVFDSALRETDRLDLTRVHERVGEKATDGNESPPAILAAGAEAIWIVYVDRKGWGRGGSRMIAKHDYAGRVLSTLHVDGVIYETALSPDGRYLAMFAGGSSGAMDTVSNLRVVDLGLMTVLNAAPDTPGAAMRDSRSTEDVYFTGAELRWVDSETLIATGSTEHHADTGADRPRRWWERHFDVRQVGLTDRSIPEPTTEGETGWVGPGCDGTVETVDGGLRLRHGDESRLLASAQLLYGAPKPKECAP